VQFYRVANWSTEYENNRSREIKDAAWVPVPNNFDGDGYIFMVSGSDGPAAYAGWIGILLVASRCRPRGDLIQTTGQPHTPASIAAKCRLPVECIELACKRSTEVGWLVPVDGGVSSPTIPHKTDAPPHTPAVVPHPPAEKCDPFRENGTEQNRKTTTTACVRARTADAIDRIKAMLGRDISATDRYQIVKAEDTYAQMGAAEIHGQQVGYLDLFDRAVGVAIAEPGFQWRSGTAFCRYVAAIVQRAVDARLWPGEREEPSQAAATAPVVVPMSKTEQDAIERAYAKQRAREAVR